MKAIQSTWLSAVALGLFTFAAPTKSTAVSPIAGPIFNPATGHNYYLLQQSDWTDAQSEALNLGGNLTTINDAGEGTWVTQEFADYGGTNYNLWIGLNAIGLDGGNSNNFSWVDGETSTYRDWAPGEPNFSDQYAEIIGVTNSPAFGMWNNVANGTVDGYDGIPTQLPNAGVVEVVPEPASYLLVLLGSLALFRGSFRRSRA